MNIEMIQEQYGAICGKVSCGEGGSLAIDDIVSEIKKTNSEFTIDDIGEIYISCIGENYEISRRLRSIDIYTGIKDKISISKPAFISKEFLDKYFAFNEISTIKQGTEFVIYYADSEGPGYGDMGGNYHVAYAEE